MPGGQPRKFKTASELQKACDDYFEKCEAEGKPYTITGLALGLGFCDRASIYDNEKIPEYSHIIKSARLKVENGYELNLHHNNTTGSIFALKVMGWRDGDRETQTQTIIIKDKDKEIIDRVLSKPPEN